LPIGIRRDFDKALADYEQAIRINPGYAPTYYNRGLAYFERRDYDRAIRI
jgi:tetratricopeptide (TPR) repeat protein